MVCSLRLIIAVIAASVAARARETCEGAVCNKGSYLLQRTGSVSSRGIPGHLSFQEASQYKVIKVVPTQRMHPLQMRQVMQRVSSKLQRHYTQELDEKTLIEKILAMAKALTDDSDAEEALKEMEEGLTPHREAILKAIEEFSKDEGVEDASNQGLEITGTLLQHLFGLNSTPEVAPAEERVQGDMAAPTHEDLVLNQQAVKAGRRFVTNLWEDSRHIKFCLEEGIADSSKQAFYDAVQHFHDLIPCVGFQEIENVGGRCATSPSFMVKSSGGGCWAYVGQYADSSMNLQPNGCDTIGIAAHELGHVIGMLHEQSRTDAANYVEIMWDNIQPSYVNQYDTSSSADTTVDYDVMSLMHYSDDAFAKSGMKTMRYIGPPTEKLMGNRMGLTQPDAEQVASMYGCLGDQEQFKLCTNNPDGCTYDDCVCHQGSGTIRFTEETDQGQCSRCLRQCSSEAYYNYECACPAGCTKLEHSYGGYWKCNDGCTAPATTTTTTVGTPPSEGGSSSTSTTTTTTSSTTTTTTASNEGSGGGSGGGSPGGPVCDSSTCASCQSDNTCSSCRSGYMLLRGHCTLEPDDEIQKWLKSHNILRCVHGADPVEWNEAGAESAMEWAEHLDEIGSMQHDDVYNEEYPAGPGGENLAMAWPVANSPAKASTMWYDEVDCCNSLPGCQSGSCATGHFTAMVWKGVTRLGCATAGQYNVCRYGSADTNPSRLSCNSPNMGGCYEQQVAVEVKSVQACINEYDGGSTPTPPTSPATPAPTPAGPAPTTTPSPATPAPTTSATTTSTTPATTTTQVVTTTATTTTAAPGDCTDTSDRCGSYDWACGMFTVTLMNCQDGSYETLDYTKGGDCDATCGQCGGGCGDGPFWYCSLASQFYCGIEWFKTDCPMSCGIC